MKKSTPPIITVNDMRLFRVMKLFGYADRYCLEEFLTIGKQRNYYRRRTQMLEYRYLEKFGAFFPPEVNPQERESYYVYTLGEKGLKLTNLSGQSIKGQKRSKDAFQVTLAHQCLLSRCVLEIIRTLENAGYDIVSIHDEGGDFKTVSSIRPDATVVFATRENTVRFGAFYIELERNYLDHPKLSTKLKRYINAITNKKFDQVVKQDLRAQRVIYITGNENKAKDLIEKSQELGLESSNLQLLVSSYQSLCTHGINNLYTNPFTKKKHTLTSSGKED